jgi:hypothetical protein
MQSNLNPSPNSSPRQSPWKWIAIGAGAFLMLCCGGPLALVVVLGLSSEHSGGVQMANEVEPYVLEYIQKHELLEADEKLVVYYDESLALDGSEAALLTTRRLLYHNKGRNTSMLLKDIADIQHREEALTGDIIEAVSRDGERMRIEIASLNDGQDFLTALRDGWKRARQGQEAGEDDLAVDDAP